MIREQWALNKSKTCYETIFRKQDTIISISIGEVKHYNFYIYLW